ncbi:TPA: hypothetical protein JA989_05010 [Legionella pneumophila]|uniref:S41 family peptidase n=1 Tax=Legionella pneumophila TaxID=446 RepID=UPI000777282A|nr:S41 family peptidase [Legionella pneumophila]HAT8647497.1 hypothetical protein [Legionella pneumophila]HAU0838081.1 S41 family peptidase [Legionella pneumophila]HAU0882167.1 S41 family peptidase [Legionella pneumophila]
MQRKSEINPEILPQWQIDLINQVLNTMDNYYCLPDKFSEKKEELKNALVIKCKEVNETILNDVTSRVLPSPEQYKELSSQLNEVLHNFDPHLELEYNPKFIEKMKTGNKVKPRDNSVIFDFSEGPPKEEIEKWNQYEQDNPNTRNFGFIDYQGPSGLIPDNIGYVNISHLIDPQLGASETEEKYRMGPNAIKRLHEVMNGLQKKEGIILDLSVTPYGGSPEMVQNIVSFFMPDDTPINTVHDRITRTQKTYEAISTPCKLLDKPVVILVGPNTFSGREETAYDLQQFNTTLKEKRFTVMGQSTKGGAHPECSFPLVDTTSGGINDTFVLRVPYATSINPISGTNWEDGSRGVQPDIVIPKEENSLVVAVEYLISLIPQYSNAESVIQTPHITGETEELLASRERIQEFKAKVPHAPDISSNQEDVKKDDSLTSPF